jgi:hypothetical protein
LNEIISPKKTSSFYNLLVDLKKLMHSNDPLDQNSEKILGIYENKKRKDYNLKPALKNLSDVLKLIKGDFEFKNGQKRQPITDFSSQNLQYAINKEWNAKINDLFTIASRENQIEFLNYFFGKEEKSSELAFRKMLGALRVLHQNQQVADEAEFQGSNNDLSLRVSRISLKNKND